jgi:hypothetical protein
VMHHARPAGAGILQGTSADRRAAGLAPHLGSRAAATCRDSPWHDSRDSSSLALVRLESCRCAVTVPCW